MFLVPPDLGRSTGPSWRTAMRNVFLLALTPGIVLWLAISAFGKLFTGPLKSRNLSESDLNRSLQHTRTPFWDAVTAVWSHIGNTEIIIGVCLIAVVLVFWRTRHWWFAVIPAIAVSLQAAIFVAATVVTGRCLYRTQGIGLRTTVSPDRDPVRAHQSATTTSLEVSADAWAPLERVAQRSGLGRRHLDDQASAALDRHPQNDATAFLGDLERPVSGPRLHRRHG